MDVIKIPSSNIYNIEDNNSLIKQNKITKAEVSANEFTTESGNVLSKEYVSTFWQEKRSENIDGGISFTYVGGDSSVNEILYNVSPSISTISPLNFLDEWKKLIEPSDFEAFPIDEQVYATPKSKKVKLAISDKTLLIQTDKNNNNRVTNYTLRRKARYWGFNSKENREYYFEEETSNLPLSQPLYYDSSDNTFVYNYLGGEIYNRTKHVIPDDVGDAHEYYVTIECLLSETITVEGQYYTSEQLIQQYGSGVTVDFQLPTNELVQTTNLLSYPTTAPLTENILQNVVRKYKNGKETYKLKCSIGDYYYTHGSLAIFPLDDAYENKLPATFKKHDIVEPWIYTSKGEVPLSEKADGTAKQFEVIGIDYSYAGVVWQELTLQEYIE